MIYIDGFVVVVLVENKEVYLEYVWVMGLVFKKYGVLCVMDNWGDEVLDGEVIFFLMVVKVEFGEVIVFFWIEWLFKEVCDMGME